jgi:hypothetical protein
VFVALNTLRATRMRYISGLSGPKYFSTLSHERHDLKKNVIECNIYRVIQKEYAILWEMIVCVILSKKVHMNMGLILNGYRDMVKRRYGPSCEHEQQLRNNFCLWGWLKGKVYRAKLDTRADLVARINNACVR